MVTHGLITNADISAESQATRMPGSFHSRSSPTRRDHVHEAMIAADADYRIRNTPLPTLCADRPSSFLAQLHSPLPSQLHVTLSRSYHWTGRLRTSPQRAVGILCNSLNVSKYRNREPEMHTTNRCTHGSTTHNNEVHTSLASCFLAVVPSCFL